MLFRCFKWHMTIGLSLEVVDTALDITTDENLHHYDVRCPRCRKTNRVSVDQLIRAAPGWKRERDEAE